MLRLARRRGTRPSRSEIPRYRLALAAELLMSLNRASGAGLHSLEALRSGPPSCVCANAAGVRVALEIDALGCEAAVINDPVKRMLHAGTLAAQAARLLSEMDEQTYRGGPYAEVVAVLTIDDHALTVEQASFELASIAFGPYRRIGSAYLLLPFDSTTMSRPAVPIRLRR